MPIRRLLFASLALAVAAALVALLVRVIAPGGWTGAKLAMLIGFLGQAPWTGLCAANGMIGFLRLMRGIGLTTPEPPPGPVPRCAIALTVRNEAMASVLPPLRQLLDELDAGRQGDGFTAFVLSDSDAANAGAEADSCAADSRIRYRRRSVNDGFKAGNIMDFLDHDADGFELMLVLDADSQMSASAVLRLAGMMRDDPGLGIVQHLTVGLPAGVPFPRLFQFGMRAGMRSWAAGQDWWQGDEGPYWGHNAMVRIAPFRAHARLPALPGGGAILSHDQVEAALLRAAGWGVRVLVAEDGSREANPTTLPEFLRRDARWLAGNLQYRHLLARPGLRPMGRWQLLQAILLFSGPPFALLFLAGAAWAAVADNVSPFPGGPALFLGIAWLAALYAPKLLGYAQLLIVPAERTRYGGFARVAAGIAAETVFSLLLDPVAQLSKTGAMLRVLTGRGTGWPAQDRAASFVPWRDAARMFMPHTLLGLLALWAFAQAGKLALGWSLPFVGGLVVAIPFCVASADPRLGGWLRRHGVAAMPEEVGPSAAASKARTA